MELARSHGHRDQHCAQGAAHADAARVGDVLALDVDALDFRSFYTPLDNWHPVSGNRMFGFKDDLDGGGWIYFTRGADRATELIAASAAMPAAFVNFFTGSGDGLNIVFARGDVLWRSFQNGLVKFVNDNGGDAAIVSDRTISTRAGWDDVSHRFFSPKIPWDDLYRP